VAANIPITAISDILGHADIRTTTLYAHATNEAKRRAVKALEGFGQPARVHRLATDSNSSRTAAAV